MSSATASPTAAYLLSGLELADGWTVGPLVELADGRSGSAFSVGYEVTRGSWEGFLKAFDYSEALDADDPAVTLQELASLYLAERSLHEACNGRSFDRIVRVLGAGDVRVPGAPAPTRVSYLIFERADRDARADFGEHDPADQAPKLQLAHHATVGLSQLHSLSAAHQDLKPSNFLVWEEGRDLIGKLADLGLAYVPGRPAPQDDRIIAGDPAYAAPEQLYECPARLSLDTRRVAADIYMLGDLITFLMVGVPYHGVLATKLDQNQRAKKWAGTFDEVLPGLVDAHGQAIGAIREALHRSFSNDLAQLLFDLCHPDPLVRGDQVARRRSQNQYRLDRVHPKLDLLYRKARRDGL